MMLEFLTCHVYFRFYCRKPEYQIFPDTLYVNPRTGGRVDFNPPIRFFPDSEKTAARSADRFAIAVQPTI